MNEEQEEHTEPLLSLSTRIQRPRIMIDGAYYELLSHQELSMSDFHALGVHGRRISELMGKPELTKEDEEQLSQAIRRSTDKVLQFVPQEVASKLNDNQLVQIMDVYSAPLIRQRLQNAAAMFVQKAPPSNGATGE